MYHSILLSVAFQEWERYSAHALAAREAAATLAQGAGTPLHVLSVYAYEKISLPAGLDGEMAARHRADLQQRTDALMERRMREFIGPLREAGIEVQPILHVGNPREDIVETARNVMADVLIIGSHSKRGILDIVLGGTAHHITQEAPCTVLMVSPKVDQRGQ
jgi:nucleotide-binding universal stress UspA family protein